MILYLSENKMKNLLSEMDIKMRFADILRSFSLTNIEIELSQDSDSKSVKISPFRAINKESKNKSYVLKTLRRKGKLNELSPDMTIAPLSYIISRGTLEYIKFEDGHTALSLTQDDISKIRWDEDSFFGDDILQFNIGIGHNNYDKIITKWTASNIRVFGGKNLRYTNEDLFKCETWLMYPASGDPGILHRKISVEFVIWVLGTNPNERSIVGSPLIVYC